MTGEDLGYKPGVIRRGFNKRIKKKKERNKGSKKDDKVNKVDKVNKFDNDLMYNSSHNFVNCSVSYVNDISSVDSKFDTMNKFYKDFFKLKELKTRNK